MRKGESIFKRKDGRYEARYIKGRDSFAKAIYGYVYAHSYSEAKKKRANVQLNSESIKKQKSSGNFIFDRIAADWLKNKSLVIKSSTAVKYNNILNKWLFPYFSECDIGNINTNTLNDLITYLTDQRLSGSYIKTILTVLKSIIKYAEVQGAFSNCKFDQIHSANSPNKIKVLSVESQQKLTEFLVSSPNNTNMSILLSLYAGLRIGEICALKWEDIILDESTINIKHTLQRLSVDGQKNKTQLVISEPKSSSGRRTVPVPDFIVPMLKNSSCENECYFLSGTILPTEPRVLQNRFKKILEECSVPTTNFHTLRHTFATRCVECGIDVKTLSVILGHSNVKITLDRYVHPTHEQKKNSINKLANEFFHSQNNSHRL